MVLDLKQQKPKEECEHIWKSVEFCNKCGKAKEEEDEYRNVDQ